MTIAALTLASFAAGFVLLYLGFALWDRATVERQRLRYLRAANDARIREIVERGRARLRVVRR